MMFCLRSLPPGTARLVMIPNTLYLSDCYVSEAVLAEVAGREGIEVLGPLRDVPFDAAGNLALHFGEDGR